MEKGEERGGKKKTPNPTPSWRERSRAGGEAREGVPWGCSACPHRGAGMHAWGARPGGTGGGSHPKAPVVSSLGGCSRRQSEHRSVSAPRQRERTASDLACPLNTSTGERAAAPAPGSVGFAGFGSPAAGRATGGCQMETGNRIPAAPPSSVPAAEVGLQEPPAEPGPVPGTGALHPVRGHSGDIEDTQGDSGGMQGCSWGPSCRREGGGLGASSLWGSVGSIPRLDGGHSRARCRPRSAGFP